MTWEDLYRDIGKMSPAKRAEGVIFLDPSDDPIVYDKITFNEAVVELEHQNGSIPRGKFFLWQIN